MDPLSVTFLTTLPTTKPTIIKNINSTIGQLMNSPNFGITSSPTNTFLSGVTLSYASGSGNINLIALNHTTSLTTTNNLQIVNGYFVTKGSSLTSSCAYKNYSSFTPSGPTYPNYSSITDYYRWATFSWLVPAGTKTLQIVVDGFIGATVPSIDVTEPFLRNMMVLYRLEDTISPELQNVTSPTNYSTTWINTSYLVTQSPLFNNSYSLTNNKLTYGGLANGSSDLSYSSNRLTISNLKFPIQETTDMYLYVSVGLQMDTNIAFKTIYCNST